MSLELMAQLCQQYPCMRKKGIVYSSVNIREKLEQYSKEKVLILMIGVQGSGKTTYCKEKMKDYEAVNLDQILIEYLTTHQVPYTSEVNGRINKMFFQNIEQNLRNGAALVDSGAVKLIVRATILDYVLGKYDKAILIVLNPPKSKIIKQVKGQISQRARPGLWEDIEREYESLQYQISTGIIRMGVDEVYMT